VKIYLKRPQCDEMTSIVEEIEPELKMVVLAVVQDGSAKASLKLENRMVEKAFSLDRSHIK